MATRLNLEDGLVLKFGGGISSSASEDEIDERECADGQNFILDLQNRDFRNRPPFDLLGTTPNALEIRGLVTHQKADGTVSMLVQAGGVVYQWDGANFTSRGFVNAGAKLRGRLEQNWLLDDEVIITDLNLKQPVMKWDGTDLENISHNLPGTFIAKYAFVSNERAYFGNVISNSIATPHMIVGSERSDFAVLSVSDRPSSSLGEGDPFFLLTPDLRPVNGLVEAFKRVVISSRSGSIFILSGESSKDFAFDELYPRSGAEGDESVTYIGDDVVYGRQGRIENVLSTEKFGDVQTDDITVKVKDQIETYTSWTAVYNQRLQRVYFYPSDIGELWVFNKDLQSNSDALARALSGPSLSPWSKWRTQHQSNFKPSAVMNMLDPVDGLEYIFFGDASGNLYRLEGTGTSDAGTADIVSERLSKMFSMPLDAQAYHIEGWIKYRKNVAATVMITFEFAGESVFDETIQIDIPAITGVPHWGGDIYWGGEVFFGVPFERRLTRQKFTPAGQSNEFQIKVSSEDRFEINEVGLRFSAAS